jgi:hypothetical protein
MAEQKKNSSKTDTPKDDNPPKEEPKKRVVKPTGITEVIAKYKESGWTATQIAKQNNIIAVKGEGTKQKLHFVRVHVSYGGVGVSKLSDKSSEENNTFIQNAFSNMATPVYAYVSYSDAYKLEKMFLEDINLNTPIRLVVAKKLNPTPQ